MDTSEAWSVKLTTHLHLMQMSRTCVELYLHAPNKSACNGDNHSDNFTFTFYWKYTPTYASSPQYYLQT